MLGLDNDMELPQPPPGEPERSAGSLQRACCAAGCKLAATWTSKCLSWHAKPKMTETHWCDQHAKELMDIEITKYHVEWKRHNPSSSAT